MDTIAFVGINEGEYNTDGNETINKALIPRRRRGHN